MSLERVRNLAAKFQTVPWDQDIIRLHKPILNKDEFLSVYDDLFPRVKDNLKIIVAEDDHDRITFALHMIIEQSMKNKTAIIYDMMINRNSYNQLDNPSQVIISMVKALKDVALYEQCTVIKIVDKTVDAELI